MRLSMSTAASKSRLLLLADSSFAAVSSSPLPSLTSISTRSSLKCPLLTSLTPFISMPSLVNVPGRKSSGRKSREISHARGDSEWMRRMPSR